MIWNPLRKSIWGPTLIATSILIGTLFDRIRIYVAAYSVPGIGNRFVEKHELSEVPKSILPDMADIFIIVGAIGGAIFIYLLASKVLPVINVWEQKEMLLYRVHKPFHRIEVLVLGK